MFIYTVKASRLKFFAMLICSMAVILTIASVVPKEKNYASVAVVSHNYNDISTNEERVQFLSTFGYNVVPTPIEVVSVTIPEKFDGVYEKYNDLQRSQGLNLKRYSGVKAKRYTYSITNYEGETENVVANVLVYNNNIIGGDVCKTGNDPFLHGFELPRD
ncbi:MAG: DUF4830 domain-containing protein [Ruminococcaceae bacterium]|nr:DUF4830 domain-containing protein [Oscillospiraceae bacterium]